MGVVLLHTIRAEEFPGLLVEVERLWLFSEGLGDLVQAHIELGASVGFAVHGICGFAARGKTAVSGAASMLGTSDLELEREREPRNQQFSFWTRERGEGPQPTQSAGIPRTPRASPGLGRGVEVAKRLEWPRRAARGEGRHFVPSTLGCISPAWVAAPNRNPNPAPNLLGAIGHQNWH